MNGGYGSFSGHLVNVRLVVDPVSCDVEIPDAYFRYQ